MSVRQEGPVRLHTVAPLEEYLRPSEYLDFDHPFVREFLAGSIESYRPDTAAARALFEFVRDEIAHSGDRGTPRVTRAASEVLRWREGICYAKSHLLAALLRGVGVPSGICYQRLTRGAGADSGHVIHALNTVYLASLRKWIRLDARGNRPGIDAQFSTSEERLAFPVRPEEGEVDYLVNHPQPHPRILEALLRFEDCRSMRGAGLPAEL